MESAARAQVSAAGALLRPLAPLIWTTVASITIHITCTNYSGQNLPKTESHPYPASLPALHSTMYLPTSPVGDVSRARLRRLSTWIRDELDPLVARDGPQVLRPDDVLSLHDTLIALQQAYNITISDLRASGIHKAIQEIAGKATRWPGRLCDDCDKLIHMWTVKFGPFSQIHPFLYGRGGRLEGIASVAQYSRPVSKQCRWL